MKLSLQLKLGQQLTMTPQLQQAIRLLQLSTLDLQQEIHEALENNPMLELAEEDNESNNADAKTTSENTELSIEERLEENQEVPINELVANKDTSNDDETSSAESEDWPQQDTEDSTWDDNFGESYSNQSPGSNLDYDFESRDSAEDTLQDHLRWQLNLTHLSDRDTAIGEIIIDAIDTNGCLTSDIESLAKSFHSEGEEETDRIDQDEVLAVLHRIQRFDPVGVAYRTLSECLLVQLDQMDQCNTVLIAKKIVSEYIKLLGSRDYTQIMRRLRIKESSLIAAVNIIENLNPRPGSDISPRPSNYIIPDVLVKKDTDSGQWRVELNPEISPKLRINTEYAALIGKTDTSEDNSYLKSNLQEAKWFIKSLQSRNETLMKVSVKIIERQQGFLEQGDEAMKPLVLNDIATAIGMHESTISRVTNQKYMNTPQGNFELKYFFSSHVSTVEGGECSSTAIRAIIKKLILSEDGSKPLSDSKITENLKQRGVHVARRTIAKYREALMIPPSNERKRLS
jgi:RNA polymerase sigma-54 factor